MIARHDTAEQLRIDQLERQIDYHRDTALRGSDVAGVTGIIVAVGLALHLLAKCGPTLLPWLFS
ncbi:hypothetical protein [Novosphingobium sp.]|uniref:hypothetical protein n=1 Tax=Novosphingobium sp. TaxID=1874826 RepID=UPI0038BBD9B1